MPRWVMLSWTEEAWGGKGDVWGGKGDEVTLIRHFDSFAGLHVDCSNATSTLLSPFLHLSEQPPGVRPCDWPSGIVRYGLTHWDAVWFGGRSGTGIAFGCFFDGSTFSCCCFSMRCLSFDDSFMHSELELPAYWSLGGWIDGLVNTPCR